MRWRRITLSATSYHNGGPFSMLVSRKSSAAAGSCVEMDAGELRSLPNPATAIAAATDSRLSLSNIPQVYGDIPCPANARRREHAAVTPADANGPADDDGCSQRPEIASDVGHRAVGPTSGLPVSRND